MRFLTPTEWQAWCGEHRVPLNQDWTRHPSITAEHYYVVDLPYPKDSGAKVNLARRLLKLVPPESETLLLLADWAVFPSCQHMPLFTRFREALGERRPLIETPGHIFTSADHEDAVSIVAMSLLFIWDCYGISASGRDAFYLSHDEFCYFASRDASVVANVAPQFE
jgi:hypothetical protein